MVFRTNQCKNKFLNRYCMFCAMCFSSTFHLCPIFLVLTSQSREGRLGRSQTVPIFDIWLGKCLISIEDKFHFNLLTVLPYEAHCCRLYSMSVSYREGQGWLNRIGRVNNYLIGFLFIKWRTQWHQHILARGRFRRMFFVCARHQTVAVRPVPKSPASCPPASLVSGKWPILHLIHTGIGISLNLPVRIWACPCAVVAIFPAASTLLSLWEELELLFPHPPFKMSYFYWNGFD